MARVTVEDCIKKVENRFELVLYAAERAREISSGSEVTVDVDDDKSPVIALREIADDRIMPNEMHDKIIKNYQRYSDPEDNEIDEDFQALISSQKEDMGEEAAPEKKAAAEVVESDESFEAALDEAETASDESSEEEK